MSNPPAPHSTAADAHIPARLRAALRSAITVAVLAGCDDPVSPTQLSLVDATAHANPSGLTATPSVRPGIPSQLVIILNWPDNARDETGWEIYRSTTGATGAFSLVMVQDFGNSMGQEFGNLPSATQYCYKVRSYKIAAKRSSFGAFSNVACATTFALPAAPSELRGAPKDGGAIDLTWKDNTSDEYSFAIHRSGSPDGGWEWLVGVQSNTTAYRHGSPPINVLSCYRVIAVRMSGNLELDSEPSNVSCTGIPAAPSDLSATVVSQNVQLAWPDNSSIEDGYEVWRSSGGVSSRIATLPANATAYTDVSVPTDVVLTYQLRATRDGGVSQLSNAASAGIATRPPNPPEGVNAAPAGSTLIGVSWTSTLLATGYRVERSADAGATWTAAGVAEDSASVFYDAVSPEDTVHYRVVAVNAFGESAPSQADFTAAPNAPTPIFADEYGVSWEDNSSVEDGYQVWTCTIVDCFPTGTTGPDGTYAGSGGLSAIAYMVAALRDGGYSDIVSIYLGGLGASGRTAVERHRKELLRRRKP